VTNRSFDFETETVVSVAVIATDSALAVRQVTFTVDLAVVDVNDNSPVFPVLPYSGT
jgi:hypothetical protein